MTTYAEKREKITFPMFELVKVNTNETHPLWHYLKNKQKGIMYTTGIKWNFTKFLVAPDGKVVRRYPPTTKPEDIRADIEKLLPA